jgi:hypothetical protein
MHCRPLVWRVGRSGANGSLHTVWRLWHPGVFAQTLVSPHLSGQHNASDIGCFIVLLAEHERELGTQILELSRQWHSANAPHCQAPLVDTVN